MRKILLNIFSHRTLALLRWDYHFLKVKLMDAILFRNKKFKEVTEKVLQPTYLNLGSGPRGIVSRHWVNVDGFPDQNVQYVCDFNKPLPFKDDFFDGIFCEHVLEHFDVEHGKKLLIECKRILKPSGCIRIIIPDGELIMKSYFDNPSAIIDYKKPGSKTAMEAVNMWFYQRYEHQCIYDFTFLKYILSELGFSAVSKSTFNSTELSNHDLLIDDEKYKWESLYVDARK